MMEEKTIRAYEKCRSLNPLFSKETQSYLPLTYGDSLAPVPDYPFCTLGVLNAEAEWGKQKSVAFVVGDNYLLTCASNCFSHKHGEYTNITFIISSNRKHGYDTYKIVKVFIPKQYKNLPEDKRVQFDYALLYIQGEPNLKDKYGGLKIAIDKDQTNSFTYQCAINGQGLRMISQFRLEKDRTTIPSKCVPKGMPRIKWNKWDNTYAQVEGLIVQHSKSLQLCLTKFIKKVETQLSSWCKSNIKDKMTLNDINPWGLNLNCLKGMIVQPIDTIQMFSCKADDETLTKIFQKLPFSSISKLQLQLAQVKVQLSFLKSDKFANLKETTISNHNVGACGCENIVNIPLRNLRKLCFVNERLGSKGCEIISKGNWPFLRSLALPSCELQNTGLEIVTNMNFKNLLYLDLYNNSLDQEASQILEKTDFPRIRFLILARNKINNLALAFLKAPTWQNLVYLDLENNLVGNKGCKMIRQSACVFRHLRLEDCKIDDIGVKWLCKLYTNRMISLRLTENKIGCQGCLYLAKANFPCLRILDYSRQIGVRDRTGRTWRKMQEITARGFKSLLVLRCDTTTYIQTGRNIFEQLCRRRR